MGSESLDQSFDTIFRGQADLEELEDYVVDSLAVGHYDQALSALARLAVTGDEIHRYHLDRATIYLRLGNPRMAKIALDKALAPGSTLSAPRRQKAQELLAVTNARASSPSRSTFTVGLGYLPMANTSQAGVADTSTSRFAGVVQGRFRESTSQMYPDFHEIQLNAVLGRGLDDGLDVGEASFEVRFVKSVAAFKESRYDTKWRNQFSASSQWVAASSPLREFGESWQIDFEASTGIEGPLGLDTRGSADLFFTFNNFDLDQTDRLSIGLRGTHQTRLNNHIQFLFSANLGLQSDHAIDSWRFFAGSSAQFVQGHKPIFLDATRWRARLESNAKVQFVGSFADQAVPSTTTLRAGLFERLEQANGLQFGLGIEGFATLRSVPNDNDAGVGLTFEMAYSF